MILGVDVLVDSQVRSYSLADEDADIPDPLLFLAKPDSILITRTMADREGIKIDQKIAVETVQGTREFRVRGILNPEGPAKVMGGNLALMDIYAAQMAFGKEGRIDRVDVSLLRGEKLETVKQRLETALPAGYTVETPIGRGRQIESMLSNFQTGLDLVSFFAIIVGMYLIYNAVSISIVRRRKEIGILRALGATRGQVMRLFLGETLVISIIASFLGVGLGILFAESIVGILGKVISQIYVRTAVTDISITWQYPVLGIACGIAASLAAAVLPVLAGSRISPVSAIRSVPWSEEGFFTGRRLNTASAVCIMLAATVFCLYRYAHWTPLFRSTIFLFSSQLFLLLGISLFMPTFLRGFHFPAPSTAAVSTRLHGNAGRPQPEEEPEPQCRGGCGHILRHFGFRKLGRVRAQQQRVGNDLAGRRGPRRYHRFRRSSLLEHQRPDRTDAGGDVERDRKSPWRAFRGPMAQTVYGL